MEIDRRTLLSLLAVVPFSGRVYAGDVAADAEPLFLAARTRDAAFEVAVIGMDGQDRFILPVEARGHSFAVDAARRRAVAFARSPGRYAVAFDVDGRRKPVPIVAAPGRHFFGHGIFSPDGKLMFATESDYEAGRGVTGIYDATGSFRRIGEIDSAGIGPHELVLMPDGRTACVANGGILTHPDYERLKLNIDTMKPSLAYVDLQTGALVEQVFLASELHKLSIRHMSVDAGGTVWFGCQYEGDPADRPPLVGRHRRGREPELFAGPEATLRRLDNYIGSMAIDASGTIVATSSPRGGIVAFWDTASGRMLGEQALADGCGVAPAHDGTVLATSGRGELAEFGTDGTRSVGSDQRLAWDNHLRRI